MRGKERENNFYYVTFYIFHIFNHGIVLSTQNINYLGVLLSCSNISCALVFTLRGKHVLHLVEIQLTKIEYLSHFLLNLHEPGFSDISFSSFLQTTAISL